MEIDWSEAPGPHVRAVVWDTEGAPYWVLDDGVAVKIGSGETARPENPLVLSSIVWRPEA